MLPTYLVFYVHSISGRCPNDWKRKFKKLIKLSFISGWQKIYRVSHKTFPFFVFAFLHTGKVFFGTPYISILTLNRVPQKNVSSVLLIKYREWKLFLDTLVYLEGSQYIPPGHTLYTTIDELHLQYSICNPSIWSDSQKSETNEN